MVGRALMILGTASHVGKSLLTAGLGRIFSDDGLRVTPFKAQNMSLNSASTPDGREIGRAQALQAEACRAVPCAEMNPVLIKPTSDTGSQVILLGRVWGQVTAADYFRGRVEELFPAVLASYQKLAEAYELILLEGAGSPAEINLRKHDIVNMRMAHAADASCLLVGDIDRGGVFASLLGTIELLEAEDRARIRGFVINKFRGDISLLHSGIEMMERRLEIPCAGVVPFLCDVGLEEEDSVAMEDRRTAARVWRNSETDKLRIGVVAVPHMANFTDFDALAAEPAVSLAFLEKTGDAAAAHIIILPGTKQTLDDMQWLLDHGFDALLRSFSGMVIGICGGFQMLGTSIEDPLGVESGGVARSVSGLGMLGIHTLMQGEKTVRQVTGRSAAWGGPSFTGYEIHMGETCYAAGTQPFAAIGSEFDGAADAQVAGTYVHGLFDNDAFRHNFLEMARERCGLKPAASYACVSAQRQSRLDIWADHLRKSLNMNLIRGWVAGTMTAPQLAFAYGLDWLAGDPEWFPHPVRLFGSLANAGERLLRPIAKGPRQELVAGSVLTASVVFAAWTMAKPKQTVWRVMLAWTALATRSLLNEAAAVVRALESQELESARKRLSRIVGRDTQELDQQEISRALIETLAESACDGIVAPLFWLAAGGVPAAMAYKAINTLDSMIGHKDERYLYFGRTAARLDDAVSFLPARVTAAGIAAAAFLIGQDAKRSWRVFQRDGGLHASPNAGQSEAAMAGALNVQLGGLNVYAGVPHHSALLNAEGTEPTAAKARKALLLVAIVSGMAFGAAFLVLSVRRRP